MREKGIVVTSLFIIFSVAVLAIALVGSYIYVWPILRYGAVSPCWGQFVSDVEAVHKISFDEHTVRVGDCVHSLNFVNKKQLEQSFRTIQCPTDSEGFIIAIPAVPETDFGLKFWLWPPIAWDKAKEWWKSVGGIEPLCKGLKNKFSEIPDPFFGPQAGSNIYCMQIEKGDGLNTLVWEEGECAV